MVLIPNPGNWVDKIIKILQFLADKDKERTLTKDEASKKFREAIIETKIYISQYERKKVRNFEKEESLSIIWFEAARLIKKDNVEILAEECNEMAFALLSKELTKGILLEDKVSALFCKGQGEDYAMVTKRPENKQSDSLSTIIKFPN